MIRRNLLLVISRTTDRRPWGTEGVLPALVSPSAELSTYEL